MPSQESDRPEPSSSAPHLLTLVAALAPYPGVSVRTARRLIRCGRLPAAKIGRSWYVRPADVARLFATAVLKASAHSKESARQRMDQALRKAGFLIGVEP